MQFGPKEIEALRQLNLADLYRVGALQAHCLSIELDRDVFWPMIASASRPTMKRFEFIEGWCIFWHIADRRHSALDHASPDWYEVVSLQTEVERCRAWPPKTRVTSDALLVNAVALSPVARFITIVTR